MSVLLVGMSHRSAPVALLERLSMDAEVQNGTAGALVKQPSLSEAMIISTCNRLEVYTVTNSFHAGVQEVVRVLTQVSGVGEQELRNYLYVRYADAAAEHLLAGDLRRDGDLLAGDAAHEPDALDLDDLGREDGALGAHDDLLLIGPQVALAVGPLAVDVGGAGPRLDRRGRGRRTVDRHPDDLDLLAAQRDGERDVLGDDPGPDDDALPCHPLGADDEALLADHEAVAVIEALDGPVVTVDGVLGRVVGHAVRPRRRDDLRRWAQQASPDPRSPQARWELRTTAQGWEDVPP